MIYFTLKKDSITGLYAVYENGVKATHPIFSGIDDFLQELKALDFKKAYQVEKECDHRINPGGYCTYCGYGRDHS